MAQGDSYPVLTNADFPPLQNDLIFKAVRGEEVEKVPVWIMRQAGRYLPEFRQVREQYDFFTVCRTPELACKVTLQPIDRYSGLLDASIIFCDILVVPQAMGMEVQMLPQKGPHFPEPLLDPSHMAKLQTNVNPEVELKYVLEAITLTRKELKGRVPLFGFVGAPWTLMAYMIEGGGSKTLSKAKAWLGKWPAESKELLQSITDVVVDFLVGQVKAGAQLLQIFDSWAGELSPDDFATFSLPYLLQISTRVREKLQALSPELAKIPISVFARGAHYALELLPPTHFDIVSLDWTIDPATARKRTNGSVALQGNADPSLLYAPRDTIRSHVKRMMNGFGRRKYIANLGHGMYPDHDPERLRNYLEAIRDFSV
ncbi:uroporphyrinogen decarboxylase [Gaertneriomyces semiglobifer]|nr:uroporphyrinogen decarboxylase [Gaertneriomyces semiglobifer]